MVSPEAFPGPVDDGTDTTDRAVLAGGCFWCVEAVYKQLTGVSTVVSGYAGGTKETADYRAVCTGRTDHAEAVEVRFDPAQTTYGQLLRVFFSIAHDPTTRDRQGHDVGRQYRSAIFYADPGQQRIASAYIAQLEAAKVLNAKIVTEVVPLVAFYEAETYHQDYAARNPDDAYIRYNAAPKVQKVRTYYADKVRTS